MIHRYEIDAVHSSVGFAVKHMMVATVRGSFQKFSGHVDAEEGNPETARGELVVDAASISTGVDGRDQHLRSADFLEAEKYPEIRFVLNSARNQGRDRYLLTGDLTIRGTTRPIELQAEIEGRVASDGRGNERVAVSVSGQFNRKDFGLTWNQATEMGGVLVGETMKVHVDLSLTHALALVTA